MDKMKDRKPATLNKLKTASSTINGQYFSPQVSLREAECITELLNGKSPVHAASALGLHPYTVEFLLLKIIRKLHQESAMDVIKKVKVYCEETPF